MAGAGFKTFGVGDVLTASDVNGYLMQQAVMNFADSGARGSAIGTATEGMVSYLQDTDAVEVYDGSAWVGLGGGFTASTAITATDASWSVPTLADPVVKVTVIGGGGGGGEGRNTGGNGNNGSAGSSSSFACSAGTATAAAGYAGEGGKLGGVPGGPVLTDSVQYSNNGGEGGYAQTGADSGAYVAGKQGGGGIVTVAYLDLTGVSTANVTVGSGGAGGTGTGGGDGRAGADGLVIFEYRAG